VSADFFLGGEGRLKPADAAVALILVDSTRYLMQLRDQKPGIFYPGHWGLFGGALEEGESPGAALQRELEEELGLSSSTSTYFSELTLDFSFGGFGRVRRCYYEVPIGPAEATGLVLGEGSDMRAFSASEILSMPRVVPYDALAIWMHATRDLVWSREARETTR
jgi:8-oxo-dGTP pyrophosphatase MutT (NUDIX family)